MPEVCCASLIVKYLKKSGKLKEINIETLGLEYIKQVLDRLVNDRKFHKFVDVKINNICMKTIPGLSDTDTNTDYEGDISDNSED